MGREEGSQRDHGLMKKINWQVENNPIFFFLLKRSWKGNRKENAIFSFYFFCTHE